jgi:hypothetical protein
MSAYQYVPGDIVNFIYTPLGWTVETPKTVEITGVRLTTDKDNNGAIKLGCELSFVGTNENIYDWSIDEQMSAAGFVQSTFPIDLTTQKQTYPWSPGFISPLTGDSYPGPASFGSQVLYSSDQQGNGVVQLIIEGTPPINDLDTSIYPPALSANQCQILPTGGSLTGASSSGTTYMIGISARSASGSVYENTDYNGIANIFIPSGTTAGSVVMTPNWAPGDTGADVYMALGSDPTNAIWHWNQTVSSDVGTITITSFNQATPGGPDTVCNHLVINAFQENHSGPWDGVVTGVTSNTVTITAPILSSTSGTSGTNGQLAGLTLSLLSKGPLGVDCPIVNLPILSHPANSTSGAPVIFTINSAYTTDLTTLLDIGDLLTLRFNGTFTDNTMTDSNLENSYYPSGAGSGDVGKCFVVLTGADTGDVKLITAASGTEYTIAGNWVTTPATGDLVVICSTNQASGFPYLGNAISAPNGSVSGVLATVPVTNLAGAVYLIQVQTADIKGNLSPLAYAPYRELYVAGTQGTRTLNVSGSYTQLITDGRVNCDTTSGNIVYNLLPGIQWTGQILYITKTTNDSNTVTINIDGGDPEMNTGATQIILLAQGDLAELKGG